MKNKIVSFFYLISILLAQNSFTYAQSRPFNQKPAISSWTTNNPFKTDVFVENLGQFNSWAKSSLPIKYAVNNSDKIFFTNQGVIFRLEKSEKLSEEEREKIESKGNKETAKKSKIYYISMNWEGCNPDAELVAFEENEGYYTFGEKGYENVKAKGYKKLLYKNMYPDIDVEYIIPEKGGIKYKLILHPGADVSIVKMRYSGDIKKLKKDKRGNLIIKTPAGDVIDHAPHSYYEINNSNIASSFQIKGNTVFFQLIVLNALRKNQTILIDPWTTTPTTMSTNIAALDIDYDRYGNAFFSGGTCPYKLSKYSSTGVFLWTFTNPAIWGNFGSELSYSKFCVLPTSGTTFIGEGFAGSNPGSRIMKIGNNGILTYTSPFFGLNNEIWRMFYNNCSKQLIAFGGGTQNYDNLKIITDTNLNGSISKSFNGANCLCNDVAASQMDNNGDFYAIMTSKYSCPSVEGKLQKSLFSSNYNAPCAFEVQSFYRFQESNSLLGVTGNVLTVRANAIAVNNNYVFTYDGKTIKAWNKINGSLIDSVVVFINNTAGYLRVHEGIDVDECNNVYVGGTNQVNVYSFTANSFVLQSPIITNIPDNVHDIKLDRVNGILYICGNGFVTKMNATITCNSSPYLTVNTNTTVDSCQGKACVHASGGVPPYIYQWSNGSTDSCISGVPSGIYTICVMDNSCMMNNIFDTIVINSSIQIAITPIHPVICAGDTISLTASASSPTPFLWNTGFLGNTITVSPLNTTTYTVTNILCPDTLSTIVIVNQKNYTNLNPSICQGNVFHCGNNNYTSAGIFKDTLTNISGCDSIITINLNVIQLSNNILGSDTTICEGIPYALKANYPNATYQWQDGSLNPTFTVLEKGLYWVKATIDSCNAIDSIYVEFIDCEILLEMPNVITPNGDGLNDVFVPSKFKNILKMHTQIYNRWGALIHETDKLKVEWDGKHNNKIVADGVYYWIINYTDINGKEKMIKGSLTVLT
ncbi:MAG: gliding motility-associated C-terminal domain-containing protein [Bacteroidetes bacterium]|nr:gliding motility-associated C-terminal domain-containing protein [Bacteroidota bacterium]